MQRSEERIASLESGIDICYDTFGDPDDPALLLIMGLAGPLTWWAEELCEQFADRGFYVIRYDNRDVGRSTKLHNVRVGRSTVVRGFVRRSPQPPYTISDMAGDAAGLLDHLGIDRAHVCGVSMGGMIAQTLAIEHPDRTLSLISISSTTGRRSVGWQDPRLFPMLLGPAERTREQAIERSVRTWATIGSPAYPTPAEEIRERAAETYDRGLSPTGVVRQMLAVLAQPDRAGRLQQVKAPVLVIHGLQDKLVHVSGGRATAQAVPHAELVLVPGMGHDLPRQLWPVIVDGVARTAQATRASRSDAPST